ncbi:MAG: PKD domain-containing protein, partial [Bacteroidales bacterium]|nr:PKD domain-containing protein [Bacteroidales bacterium]
MKTQIRLLVILVLVLLLNPLSLKAQIEDLYLSSPYLSTNIMSPGDTVQVGCVSHYVGFNTTGFFANVAIYASLDQTFNPGIDELVGLTSVWHSVSDTMQQVSFVVQVPVEADPNAMYLLFVTDPQNNYLETHEENNIIFQPFSVCPQAVQLPYTCDFESADWPLCWQQMTNASDGGWLLGDSATLGSPGFIIPEHGNFIATNDNSCNCFKYHDALITPNFDITGLTEFVFGFDYFFLFTSTPTVSEYFSVMVSYDDGLTWLYHGSLNGDVNWTTYSYTKPNYQGYTQFKMALVYSDNNEWLDGVAIDNFYINGGNELFQLNVTPFTSCAMGSLEVSNLTGTAPYYIQWSTGATGASITGLTPGYYSVTVTDAQMNQEVKDAYIEDWSISLSSNIIHSTGNNGSIQVYAFGGISPYSFNWSNGGTTSLISNLDTGILYTVSVTDASGCVYSTSYEIFQLSQYALSFDGLNDRVVVENLYNYNLTDSFSVSMWINPRTWGNAPGAGYGTFFSKGGINFYLHDDGYTSYQPQSMLITMPLADGSTAVANSPAYSISLDNWQHIGFTYESGQPKLYINHIEVPLSYLNNVMPYGSLADNYYSNFTFGSRANELRPYAGLIDEAKLWNRVLSASELVSNSCGVVQDASLLGYWPFNNGGYGYDSPDYSGNWNTGYLYSFIWGDPYSQWVLHECQQVSGFDIALVDIQNPLPNYPGVLSYPNEPVRVIIKNLGLTAYSGTVTVSYNFNGTLVSEQVPVSLAPLNYLIHQFATPLDSLQIGYYFLDVSIDIADLDTLNNIMSRQVNVNNISRLALAQRSNRLVFFDLNNPVLEYEFGPQLTGDFISAGTYANNNWYATTNNSNYLLKIQYFSGVIDTIGTILTANGDPITGVAGIAYDYSSNGMYAIDYAGDLWLINENTAVASYIGNTGIVSPVNLACNLNGDLYSVSANADYLYLINKTTAYANAIGWIGFDLEYAQDMEFDANTGNLYLAAYNASSGTSELRWVNTSSGMTYFQSYLATVSSYTGFAIQFEFINVFDYEVTHYTCQPGSIQLTNLQGPAPISILWSTNDTTQTLSNLMPGYYTVTVTDGNGNSETAGIEIYNQSMWLDALVNNASATASDGSIELYINGGSYPFSILWSNGETSTFNQGLAVGTYEVTVTDANGCSIISSWNVQTQLPYALAFDGMDDYASVWSYAELNLTDSFTVSMWINPKTWGSIPGTGYGTIFAKGNFFIYLHDEAYPGYADQSLIIYMPLADGNHAVANTPAFSISLNEWQHISVTYASGVVKVYINSIEVYLNYLDGIYPYGSLADNSWNSLYLGNRESLARPYNGMIDELKIWQAVLTPYELAEQDCGVTQFNNLVSYWDFNESPSSYSFVSEAGLALYGWLSNMYFSDPNSGWVEQDCPTLPAYDLSPVCVSSPGNNMLEIANSNSYPITIFVKNLGTQTSLQAFTVSWQLDNGTVYTETSNSSLLPLSVLNHTFADWLPVLSPGYHELKVMVSYPGDMNNSNDTLVYPIQMNAINTLAFAEHNGQFIMFDLFNPTFYYPFSIQLNNDYLAGGTMANGAWYNITINSKELLKVTVFSGEVDTIGFLNAPDPKGLAYDIQSGKMYMIDANGNLYQVDLNTAALSYIGNTGLTEAWSLACNISGQLYTVSMYDDYLYYINPTTALATPVGWVGFDAANFEDLDFNLATGELILIAYNENAKQTEIRNVISQSGESYNMYLFYSNITYSGFAIYNQAVPALQAQFSADVTQGLSPLSVNFMDATSGNPTSWFWDFGDGNYAYSQHPSHTYQTPGFYTVTLIASNAQQTDTLVEVNYILVNPNQQGPAGWYYSNTGSNHTVLIPEYATLMVNGSYIDYGDYIGVFYDSAGTMACGGFVQWLGVTTAVTVWGAQNGLDDGFEANEAFTWKIFDSSEGLEYAATAQYDTQSFPNTGYYADNGLSGILELTTAIYYPDWYYVNTGSSHSILIMAETPITIDGVQISNGDFLGVFYDNNGYLQCGGYIQWTGYNLAFSAWGDDSQTPEKDGFATNEAFVWKIWRGSDQTIYDATASYIQPPVMPNTGFYETNGMSG